MTRAITIGILIILVAILLVMSLENKSEERTVDFSKLNDYPIVLVHGQAGWGRDEAFGFKYWGGLNDIEAYLNKRGYCVYTAVVGTISSNYDRAVELYYYIKGGTVDYGAAHAKKYGHSRYGRTFKGIYPEWNHNHPIHLVGHSMGGLTSRALVDFLIDGNAEEQAYAEAMNEELSPLFEGNKQWVHSISTIGTPHNGSTFADDENELALFIKELVFHVAAVSGGDLSSFDYDFKLDQWGIKREAKEDFDDYLDRVMSNSIWDSEDISIHDLDTKGAAYHNTWMDTHKSLYYFSYTGQTTFQEEVTGRHIPSTLTNPILVQPAFFIGSFTRSNPDPVIDESWWPNDGLVSNVSSLHPTNHPASLFQEGKDLEKGVWYYYPVCDGWDHLDQLGFNVTSSVMPDQNIMPFYENMVRQLLALPND